MEEIGEVVFREWVNCIDTYQDEQEARRQVKRILREYEESSYDLLSNTYLHKSSLYSK